MKTFSMKVNGNLGKGWVGKNLARLANGDWQFLDGIQEELLGRLHRRAARGKSFNQNAGGCPSANRKLNL
ncbi:MAG: hypothetical protein ACLQSR_08030 [Limisphaerales bacterium]